MNCAFAVPPRSGARPIVPLFLPFAGCPHRCIFCAQDRQTGTEGGLAEALLRLQTTLDFRLKRALPPCEIAFFGGTFTLVSDEIRNRCLEIATRYKHLGIVEGLRCSTRPDAVTDHNMRMLRESGMELVELGIQSFDDAALLSSRRGYNGKTALQGCRTVQNNGLKLGIQLLPGMPGSSPAVFLNDVCTALELRPSCMRFYPCLVVKGTPLEQVWRKGEYTPWSIDQTVAVLARALKMAWEVGVPVIRLSVAPEPGFDSDVIAGPRHASLGNMIQARALFESITAQLGDTALKNKGKLHLPRYIQGIFFGHKGNLLGLWAQYGITPKQIEWHEGNEAFWREG